MKLSTLIIKELLFRKINFLLSILSIIVATSSVIISLNLLKAHDIRTTEFLNQKTLETRNRMKSLEEDYRKITKKMGFNVLILPKDQNLGDFYADSYASKYMPESYVAKLASSKAVTVRHLLPSLQQKIQWEEQKRTIILVGIRGEVPMLHKDPKKPIVDAVEKGTAVIGHHLATTLNLKVGDKTSILEKEFTINKIHKERGNKDDITIWIDLKEAQNLLNKPDKINGILALECKCAWANLDKVRKELMKILPNTQVLEFASLAKTRFETRMRAELAAKNNIADIKKHEQSVRLEQEKFALIFIPVILIASIIWIGFLAWLNTLERKFEIGVLKALGLSSMDLLFVFLAKSAILGIIGGVIGYAASVLFLKIYLEISIVDLNLLNIKYILAVLILPPILSIISVWIPALLASQKEPADILRID